MSTERVAWWGEQTSAGPHSWQLLVVHQFGIYPGRPQNLLGCWVRALIGETPPPEPGRSRWAEHILFDEGEASGLHLHDCQHPHSRGSRGGACGNVNSSTPSPFPFHSLCPRLWSPPHSNPPLRHGSPQAHLRAILLPAGRKSDLEREPPKLRMVAGIRYESTLPSLVCLASLAGLVNLHRPYLPCPSRATWTNQSY